MNNKTKRSRQYRYNIGLSLVIGMGMALAIGIGTHNLAAWSAVELVMGIVIGTVLNQ